MKENKYDNDIFFEKYSQMERSKKGLSGAGEWETLKALLPDFQGQRLLDLGCGYGWHCIYAMEHGAVSAVGVDISGKMLEVAREKTEDSRVRYVECAMEDIDFPDESFDVVLSSLAFHYVESFSQVVDKVRDSLAPGGISCFPWSIPYLLPTEARIGTTMKMETSSIFLWIIITMRGSARLCSWEKKWLSTTEP